MLNNLWETFQKSKLIRSFLFAILTSFALGLLLNSGFLLKELEYWAINSYYNLRSEKQTRVDDSILVSGIFDDDLNMSRWPWSWDRFTNILNTFNKFNVNSAMITEDIFGELGSTTINKEAALKNISAIKENAKKGHINEIKKIISSNARDFNQEFIEVVKNNQHLILSQKFIIPDPKHQIHPEVLTKKAQLKKTRFFEEKREALKHIEKFSLPWPDGPQGLLQAIDVIPIRKELAETTNLVGFDRIWPDSDGTVRRSPTVVYYDKRIYFSRGIMAILQHYRKKISDIELTPGKYLRIKNVIHNNTSIDINIPIDKEGLMYINWTAEKQGHQFNNITFEALKKLILLELKKDFFISKEFDPELIPAIREQFINFLSNSGFVEPSKIKEHSKDFYSSLAIWLIHLCIFEFELEIQEVGGAILGSLEEEKEENLEKVFTSGICKIYESIKLNYSLKLHLEDEPIISFEEALTEFDINTNLIYVKTLMDFQIFNNETFQKLYTNNFVTNWEDSESDFPILEINYSELSKEEYIEKLKTDLNVDEKTIEDLYLTFFHEFAQISKSAIKFGYDNIIQAHNEKYINKLNILYFGEPINIVIGKNKTELSLLDLTNKKVFLGLTATGLAAQNPTPYAQRETMFTIAPTILSTITTDSMILDYQNLTFIIIFIFALAVFILTFYARFFISLPTIILLILGYSALCFFLFFDHGIIINLITPLTNILLSYIVANIYIYWEEQQEKKKIRGMFSAMVSPEVLKIMEEDPDKFNLQGEKVEASMFSSDVSGFTSISEGVTARELAQILNLYLTPMSNSVMTYGGYVEKYEGDAIKADFGMPLADEDHAWKACYSALLQQEELFVVQRMLQLKYGVMITARMGVNTGNVNAGNMGSEKKMQYCAIGEEVAMAEELEPANKMWETWIAISPETLRLSGDRLETRLLDNVIFDHVTIPVYELLSWDKEQFLSFWEGKPIPKLDIEGWEKIIPEKILAYLDYYRKRKEQFKGFVFFDHLISSYGALEADCIEYVRLNDKLNIHDIETRYDNLVEKLNSFGQEFDENQITAVDISELERFQASFEQAKEPWRKKLNGQLLELKKFGHLVEQLGDKLQQSEKDEFNTDIDTLEKNLNCSIKRNNFPDENDKFGNIFKEHLVSIIPNPYQDLNENSIKELQDKIKTIESTIKQGMTKYIAHAKTIASDYHAFIANHCLITEEKRKVCGIFAEGRELYLNREWDKAIEKFEAGLALVEDDGPCAEFIKRCEANKKNPPADDWNGDWVADW